jgi:hypothetical protein
MKINGWVDGAIRRLPSAVRERLVLDPLSTMVEDLHLDVRASPHLSRSRSDGGACDGVSFLDDGVVLYAPTPFSKRENFTLAHELGHWLINEDERLLVWLADQDSPAQLLETLCDAIAQKLLLPDDLVRSVVRSPPRVRDILDLAEQSVASIPASAIAVAARLPGLGAAIIVDPETREVLSSTVHPDPEQGWPTIYPWRGDRIPSEHSLLNLGEGGSFTRKSFWRSRWGRHADFYIDAIATNRQIIALFASSDVWATETLSNLDDRDWDRRVTGQFFCCGKSRTVRGWPCGVCGRHFCPVCEGCLCTARAANEGECVECHTLVGKHLLTDGRCEICA